jgi:hypothetical protein
LQASGQGQAIARPQGRPTLLLHACTIYALGGEWREPAAEDKLCVPVPSNMQVFAATSADTDSISESSLRMLDQDLEKLPPTVLAAPPGDRVHLVRQHLLADRSAAKAADQSSVGGGDSGGGPSGSAAASDPAQSWTAIKMMELQLQCSTGRAREVFSCLDIASSPVVQIYAVMSCGSASAAHAVTQPGMASRPGVPAPVAAAAGLSASFSRFVKWLLVHGPDLPFDALYDEHGNLVGLVPDIVVSNEKIFERFPEGILTEAVLRALRARRLKDLPKKTLVQLFQGAYAVQWSLNIEAAESVGACPAGMWLLQLYLAPFFQGLGFDPEAWASSWARSTSSTRTRPCRGGPRRLRWTGPWRCSLKTPTSGTATKGTGPRAPW